MNRWFETLQQTLDREKIPEDPKKAPLVPLQVYAASLGELREAFSRWFQTCLPADARIRVFVDGVEKKCSEGPTAQIDREFRALFSEAGLPFRWTDLSAELSVPPRDFHASHASLERIRGVVREGKEDAVIVLGSGSITDLLKHALVVLGAAAIVQPGGGVIALAQETPKKEDGRLKQASGISPNGKDKKKRKGKGRTGRKGTPDTPKKDGGTITPDTPKKDG